jgi:flagellar motor switch protein FliM
MGETDRHEVLRRKARAGREEHQARVMAPPRALRLAIARAAEQLFEMALTVTSIEFRQVIQDQAIAAFSDDRLLMVLDGPQGALGAASVEVSVLSGLIEMQTMGQVLPRAPDQRVPTQTDAALVAPFLHATFHGFAENLGAEKQAQWAEGYRFGAMIDGTRMLSLLLEAPDFHLFRLKTVLGETAKEGEIVIALPVALPVEPVQTHAEGEEDGAPGCRLQLGQGALLAAEAPLTAVLHRIKMPLADISGLKPGDLLPIPRERLIDTRLVAGTEHRLSKCRLGQINGFRAVRLVAASDAARHEAGLDDGADDIEQPGESLHQLPGGLPGELTDLSDSDIEQGLSDEIKAKDQALADPGRDDEPDPPELTDLPELGQMGDLSDLTELALDD